MLNLNKNSIFPYVAVSIFIHFLFFFVFFYQGKSKPIFVQIPFEISFYSPVQDIFNEEFIEPKETVPEKKIEPKKKINKDDVSLNKKNKQTKEVKKEIKKPQEEKIQKQVPFIDNGNNFASSKGIMLESANFKYSYYTNSIVKKIGRYWQWSSVPSSLKAVVYFKIARDGSVHSVKIKESSKDESFDENAVRAIKLAGPFAPLPDGYMEEDLGVYFEFKFR